MPLHTHIEACDGYLLVTNTGSNDTLAESVAYVDRVLAECKRAERVRLLIDDRLAAHRIPAVDALAVAEHLQDVLGAKHVERMAVVPGPESLLTTEDFAVFMRARGMGFKVCKYIEEARTYLTTEGHAP